MALMIMGKIPPPCSSVVGIVGSEESLILIAPSAIFPALVPDSNNGSQSNFMDQLRKIYQAAEHDYRLSLD